MGSLAHERIPALMHSVPANNRLRCGYCSRIGLVFVCPSINTNFMPMKMISVCAYAISGWGLTLYQHGTSWLYFPTLLDLLNCEGNRFLVGVSYGLGPGHSEPWSLSYSIPLLICMYAFSRKRWNFFELTASAYWHMYEYFALNRLVFGAICDSHQSW